MRFFFFHFLVSSAERRESISFWPSLPNWVIKPNTNESKPKQIQSETPAPPKNLKPFENNKHLNSPSLSKQVHSSAQIALMLNDGDRQVILKKDGNIFGLRNLSSDLRDALTASLINNKVDSKALEGIASTTGVSLKGTPADAAFEVLSPVGTAVMSDQPEFRWAPVKGAVSYTVTVVRRGQIHVASSNALASTVWNPSVGQLQPGVIYRWGVVATLTDGTVMSAPGPLAPEARFKVLEPKQAARIKSLADKHAGSPLTLGVLYAKNGLIDEAEQQFEKLVRQNPRSRVARNLLESVKKLRTTAKAGQ